MAARNDSAIGDKPDQTAVADEIARVGDIVVTDADGEKLDINGGNIVNNGGLLNNKDGKMEEIELTPNGDGHTKDLLIAPRAGARKSIMEEESARERARLALLKQCAAILRQTDEKYTKETLHKTFQDEVSALKDLNRYTMFRFMFF